MELLVLALPVIVLLFVFSYLPMVGLVMAFQEFDYSKGIFGADFIGLKNFEFFFLSQDAWRISRNTIGYSLVSITLGIVVSAVIALLLYEVRSRSFSKFYQTVMILPRFLSWVIVGFVSYVFLSPTDGVFNQILKMLGSEPAMFYYKAEYWPVILVFLNIWKHVGMESLMFYAALMAIDSELFEAATIDGANRLQKILAISIPSLVPLAIIIALLGLGNVFRGDFGLFYQIPRNIGLLYETTDVIDTYIYRGLKSGDYGMTAAVGLFQSVVGLITIVSANWVVKKVSSSHSLY